MVGPSLAGTIGRARRPPAAALRPVRYGPADTDTRRGTDGVLYLASRHSLAPYPATVTEPLEHWAGAAPDRTFLVERAAGPDGEWRRISYREMLARVEAVAESLLRYDLSADRPVATLSSNTIGHAVLLLAAQHAGIPVAPLTPAYGLHGPDFARLREVFALLTPGLLHVEDAAEHAPAIAAVRSEGLALVAERNAAAVPGSRDLADLCATGQTVRQQAQQGRQEGRLAEARRRVGPDSIAKFLLTSGSTGTPKAVVNTHRMLCANQAQLGHVFAFVKDRPPVMVDWLPWNHTAGGNHNFNLVMFNGGTLHIDGGKPTPGGIELTVRNLREVSPTLYFNVPAGYEALVRHFRADRALRDTFFRELELLWYAAAAMPAATWAAIEELGVQAVGARVAMVTGLGMTETAPFAVMSTPDDPGAGRIGVPAPGIEAKLVPTEDLFEIRFRGPNVTPGYWRDPAATVAAFDEEGFYRTGDGVRLADPAHPGKGLLFEGRISEDFKLSTGTWVRVGRLRNAVLAALGGLAADVVVAAPDRDAVGLLVFPDLDACRALLPHLAGAALPEVVRDPAVREAFRLRLLGLHDAATGSSNRIAAALLLDAPPAAAAGEITEKGSVNQRRVLRLRAASADALYQAPRPAEVIELHEEPPPRSGQGGTP